MTFINMNTIFLFKITLLKTNADLLAHNTDNSVKYIFMEAQQSHL